MSEPGNSQGKGRRQFFARAAALATAAGAAVLAGPRRGAGDGNGDNATAAPPAHRGYRLTEHVRKYYRKARF